MTRQSSEYLFDFLKVEATDVQKKKIWIKVYYLFSSLLGCTSTSFLGSIKQSAPSRGTILGPKGNIPKFYLFLNYFWECIDPAGGMEICYHSTVCLLTCLSNSQRNLQVTLTRISCLRPHYRDYKQFYAEPGNTIYSLMQ